MKSWMGTAIALAIVTSTVAAESKHKDSMNMTAMAATYTGCVEAGTMPKTYTLTHAMSKDAMGHDDMTASTMTVTATKVDLGKHVGHKVTITGMMTDQKQMDTMSKDGMMPPALAVTSVKMIAKSCGM